MVVTIAKLGKNHEQYYIKDGREDDRSKYYINDENLSAYWSGEALEALGLKENQKIEVDDPKFKAIFKGEHPETGKRIRQNQKYKNRQQVYGYDFTCSSPKDVGILYALGDEETQQKILEAQREAVKAVQEKIQKQCGKVRITRDGNKRVEGGNLIFANIEHKTTRELDPHVHTHIVVMNAGLTKDGKWRALLGDEVLKGLNKEFDQIYQEELRKGLENAGIKTKARVFDKDLERKAFGFIRNEDVIDKPVNEVKSFLIIGISEWIRDEYSKRKNVIERETRLEEFKGGKRTEQQIKNSTKKRKDLSKEKNIELIWKEELESLGLTLEEFKITNQGKIQEKEERLPPELENEFGLTEEDLREQEYFEYLEAELAREEKEKRRLEKIKEDKEKLLEEKLELESRTYLEDREAEFYEELFKDYQQQEQERKAAPILSSKRQALKSFNNELFKLKANRDYEGVRKLYESSDYQELYEEAVKEAYTNFENKGVSPYTVKKLQLELDYFQNIDQQIKETYVSSGGKGIDSQEVKNESNLILAKAEADFRELHKQFERLYQIYEANRQISKQDKERAEARLFKRYEEIEKQVEKAKALKQEEISEGNVERLKEQRVTDYYERNIEWIKSGIHWLREKNDGRTYQEKREYKLANHFEKEYLPQLSEELKPHVKQYLEELKKHYYERNTKLIISSLFSSVARRAIEFHYTIRREIHKDNISNWISYSLCLPHTQKDAELLSKLFTEANMRPVKYETEKERIQYHLDWIYENIKRIKEDLIIINYQDSIKIPPKSRKAQEQYIKRQVDYFDYYTTIKTAPLINRINNLREQYQKATVEEEKNRIGVVYQKTVIELISRYEEQMEKARFLIADRKSQLAEIMNEPIHQDFELKKQAVNYNSDSYLMTHRTRQLASQKFTNRLILEARRIYGSKGYWAARVKYKIKSFIYEQKRANFHTKATIAYLTGKISHKQYQRWVKGKTPNSRVVILFEQLTGQISAKEAKYYRDKIEEKKLRTTFTRIANGQYDSSFAKNGMTKEEEAAFKGRLRESYLIYGYRKAGLKLYETDNAQERGQIRDKDQKVAYSRKQNNKERKRDYEMER